MQFTIRILNLTIDGEKGCGERWKAQKKKSNMPELYWTLFFSCGLQAVIQTNKDPMASKGATDCRKKTKHCQSLFYNPFNTCWYYMQTYCCYFCSPAVHYTSSSCRVVQHLEARHIHIVNCFTNVLFEKECKGSCS